MALGARDGRVEGDSVTDFEALDFGSDGLNNPCGFMAHDQGWDTATGAAVESVDIATADPASLDFYQQIHGSTGRFWHVYDLEFLDFSQQKSLHNFNAFRWLIEGFLWGMAYKKSALSARLLVRASRGFFQILERGPRQL